MLRIRPAERPSWKTSNVMRGRARSWHAIVLIGAVMWVSGCSGDVEQPEPPDAGDVEALILGEQMADRETVQEAYPNADVPLPETIERIRVIDELEWAEVLAECLTRNGFPATSDFGQVGVGSVPLGQDEALAVTRYVCHVQYPVRPTAPLTRSGVEYLYDYLVSEQVECLESRGASIPEPPSKATFVEEFGSAGSWWPYNFVEPGGPKADWETRLQCPEYPR